MLAGLWAHCLHLMAIHRLFLRKTLAPNLSSRQSRAKRRVLKGQSFSLRKTFRKMMEEEENKSPDNPPKESATSTADNVKDFTPSSSDLHSPSSSPVVPTPEVETTSLVADSTPSNASPVGSSEVSSVMEKLHALRIEIKVQQFIKPGPSKSETCIPNTQTPPSGGVDKHSDSPTTPDMGDVVNIGSSSSMNGLASTDARENCSDDWVMNSRCSSNTPPFRYGLEATKESGLPLLSLGPSIVEERGDNMEVDMGSVGLNEDEKAIKWAIFPFEGKQVVNNMDDIMEKNGVEKATNKKPKK
ncbi:hypothetical protein SUGI_0765490 [Cryptomeria japonica]|nr:hypothetical protein SUGI_0765490 [Cryptomeria japonica]